MKSLVIIFLFLTSCAQTPQVVKEAKQLTPTSIEEKRVRIKEILANHKEFNSEKRAKIEKVLMNTLDRSEALRAKESQLIQQIFNKTIVNKGTYNELLALKSAMDDVYDKKYQNVERTVKELKELVGIDPKNNVITEEVGSIDVFHRQ